MDSSKLDDSIQLWCQPDNELDGSKLEHRLRAGATRGDPWCCWQLALFLKYVSKKHSEAIDLIKRAANSGFAPAEFGYALWLSVGEGVKQNKKAALRWYRKSAEHGFPPGAYNLGHYLENGIACPVDKAEAARWYRIAANMGDSDAEVSMGNLWVDHMRSTQRFDQEPWAVFWYRRAAKHNNADGVFNLALCYLVGAGLPKNRKKIPSLVS